MDVFIGLIVGLFLGICGSYSYISEEDFAKAQDLCKTNNGLSSYMSGTVGNPDVTCKNGAKFELKGEK